MVLSRIGALALFLLCAATCDGDSSGDDLPPPPPCGDGVCDSLRCETDLRCPIDCGACTGSCQLVKDTSDGTCNRPCSSSCDCYHPGEMCTADYGSSPGVCVPVQCRQCSSKQTCEFTPDAQGRCPNAVTCK
jgi:hypothetical protein